MTPFKKVLVAVDFSECSADALRLAMKLKTTDPAMEMHLLHVWKPPEYIGADLMVLAHSSGVSIRQYGIEQAKRQLDQLIKAVGAGDVPREVRLGDPREVIVERAAQGFDLLILGTHGRSGRQRLFAGSVAEAVVRRSPAPVLTVRLGQ